MGIPYVEAENETAAQVHIHLVLKDSKFEQLSGDPLAITYNAASFRFFIKKYQA